VLLSNDVELNPGPENHELALFHLNVRSIRNKRSDVDCLVHEYHVISISESHLDESIPNSALVIDGFHEPVSRDRNCFGGGVMVYVSNKIHYNRRLDLEFENIEAIWIEIKFPKYILLMCTVYRPEGNVNPFSDNFQSSIEKA